MPLIDMFRALDLLATTVRRAGEHVAQPPARSAHPGDAPRSGGRGPRSLVGRALSSEQLGDDGLEELLSRHSVRELHTQGRLPVRLTLGALVVLDAARRGEERGLPWSAALKHATADAARFIDLIPDSFFIKAIGDQADDDGPSVSPGSAPSGRSH